MHDFPRGMAQQVSQLGAACVCRREHRRESGRRWPNHRIHALKAKALLSGSEMRTRDRLRKWESNRWAIGARRRRQSQVKTGRVASSNIMILQCSAPTRTFPQSHYRRGLKPVATPPPITKPQPFSVGVFLPDRTSSRVPLRIPANACGLRRSAIWPVPGHLSLSPGHSSLQLRSPNLARSPQRPQASPIQIKELRADESSSWIAALGTRR